MNPIWHSESSVKQWGGTIEDYLPIHEKMDCSKAWISDNRHRVLTHTMFWIKEVMIPIFGSYITIGVKKDKKKVSVKDICERHILEDYKMKFIPTPQDFIQEMDFKSWMQNGTGICPSAAKLYPTLTEQPKLEIKETETTQEVVVVPPKKIKAAPPSMIVDGKRGGGYRSRILD